MLNTILVIIAIAILLFLAFRMIKVILRVAFVVLLLLIAYFTNPGLERHQQAVEKKAEEQSVEIDPQQVRIYDCKVFSFTKVKQGEKESWVGIGAFTKVWIVRSLQ